MVDRRTFLRGAGAAAGATAIGGAVAAYPSDVGYAVEPSLPVDRVVRTTCSPNCTGSCGQLAFVRDERIVKIQQAADYPDPVYSPRGCMKGLSYHQQIYGEDRITTPLVRTGERGSGQFREARWDEVLDHVAAELKRIGETHGYLSIHVFDQVPGSGYVQKGANYRACAVLGMSHGTSFDYNGDLPMAMPITFGVQCAEHEAKDWANSRFLLLVGSNPVETRIPDVHFIFDAVQAGAQMVVVDPVYSSTASKADTWLQIESGTDAALALAMVKVILDEDLADEAFLRTYTDGPLLVRSDTGKRLREADLVPGGSRDRFAVWDLSEDTAAFVGTERLGMPAGIDAALEGSYDVTLLDGRTVPVTPGFGLVRTEVDRWTPEVASGITGVDAAAIASVARAYATTQPAAILMGAGANHWFHGDLNGRAYALLATVTGNIGKSGGGFSVYVGQYKYRVDASKWIAPGGRKSPITPTIYFTRGRTPTMHPDVPYPEGGFKVLVCTFANLFLQSPDLNRLHQTLRDLELIVVVDHQMTDTVKWADVVLPSTTWYEKWDLTATPLHPFLQLQQPAIAPVGESRSELWMWQELMRRIDPEAYREYFEGVTDEDAIRMILEGEVTEGITFEQLLEGPVRLDVPDPDIAFVDQIENLTPFPPRSLPAPLEATAAFLPTRRIEFYKEEDRFLEAGETVPTFKEPYDDGVNDPARYPLRLLTPHSKWRIHSTYANNPWMQEIHGGRPKVMIHPDDAAARGIDEGATIELFNERGSVGAWAHVTDAAGRGTVTLPEGWWSRYLHSGKGVNELTSSEVNPIHEIFYVANIWSPSTGWKDCRCEVRRA